MNGDPQRIVSLLASGTELVCALGLGERLVGRSHECDHPEWVKRLPVVSQPTFDVTGSSGEIDALVRQRLGTGAPLYTVDEELLASLSPDIVITQTHCEVCAVGPGDLAHGASTKLSRRAVVALTTGSLAGIVDGYREVAKVLGCEPEGRALVDRLEARAAEVARKTKLLPKRRVVCLEWVDPIFAMGNWGPELVELAGGENLLGIAGEHSTTTAWQDVLDADPDVLVVAPCGFGLARALSEVPTLERLPGFRNLSAAKSGRVFFADGNLYFNRSGPSVFDTPEILAEMLHPEVFLPRRRGVAWEKWPGVSRVAGADAPKW